MKGKKKVQKLRGGKRVRNEDWSLPTPGYTFYENYTWMRLHRLGLQSWGSLGDVDVLSYRNQTPGKWCIPVSFFQNGAKVIPCTWELRRTVLTNIAVKKWKLHLLNKCFGSLLSPENVGVSIVLLVFTETKEKISFHMKNINKFK